MTIFFIRIIFLSLGNRRAVIFFVCIPKASKSNRPVRKMDMWLLPQYSYNQFFNFSKNCYETKKFWYFSDDRKPHNFNLLDYNIWIERRLSLPEANSWHQWFSVAAWIVNSIYLLWLHFNVEYQDDRNRIIFFGIVYFRVMLFNSIKPWPNSDFIFCLE